MRLKKSGFTLLEVVIVLGIFTMIIGACLTLLSSGQFSVNLSEAQIQAEENAREALNKISRELRLSRASLVYISDSISATQTKTDGTVINFQIPVGSYDEELDLTASGGLKWGDENTEGTYISYSVNDNSQLIRSTYTSSDGSGATGFVLASNISALTFSREKTSSSLIDISVITQAQTAEGTSTNTLNSSVKLRN